MGARQAEEAIRFVGQTMHLLGVGDKRYFCRDNCQKAGTIDTRLSNMWKHWKTEDPPPSRVKPIPMCVLHKAQELADADNSLGAKATARMMWTNVFYLCRPGESCATRYACNFFRMRDVALIKDSVTIDFMRAPASVVRGATDALLTFTTQKNRHRNERIGQKASGHRVASPTVAIAEQILHLRANNAGPDTPLCAFCERGHWFVVTADMITDLLRRAVAACPECGLEPSDVSARSLRATGAMALVCAGIDVDHLRLIGRWRSDEVFTYLHVQAEPIYRDLSARMLQGGEYNFAPGSQAFELYHAHPDVTYE